MKLILTVALVAGLVAPVAASGQLAGAILRAAGLAAAAVESATAAAVENATAEVDAGVGPTPLTILVTTSFANKDQVETMSQGAILAAIDQCPLGWEPHVDEDGTPLYVPFGLLVDEHRTPRVGDFALLRACVKQ